jgi:hypothetical protein
VIPSPAEFVDEPGTAQGYGDEAWHGADAIEQAMLCAHMAQSQFETQLSEIPSLRARVRTAR